MRLVLFLLAFIVSCTLSAQEICNNGVDDDGDGLIDLQDFGSCPCQYSNSVGAPISLFANPSFELMDFCPTAPGELNGATSWNHINDSHAEYYYSCDVFDNIVPVPYPDGIGKAGFAARSDFHSFLGAELTTPLVAGQDYRMNFDIAAAYLDAARQNAGPAITNPIYLVLYGNVSTTNFPLTGVSTGIVAPTDPPVASTWEPIDSLFYTPSSNWDDRAILFTPTDAYQMIAFGPPSVLPAAYENAAQFPYFFVDDLVLNEQNLFSTPLQLSGQMCLDNVVITATIPQPNIDWYHNGVATGENGDDIDVTAAGFGPGTYTVSIGAGTAGCLYNLIVVPGSIEPEIDYTISDLCPAGPVTFTNNSTVSTGTIISSEWDLGFGTPSPLLEITRSFPATGDYNITLTVETDAGCITDSIIPISISDPPFADFSVDQNCLSQPTLFTDESVPSDANSGSAIATYEWSIETAGDLVGADQAVTFPDVASYQATLLVTSVDGCEDDTTATITISPIPTLEFESSIACAEPVNFTSTIAGVGSLTSTLSWDFGDANTEGNESTTQHQYDMGGDYLVTLTATTAEGCMVDFSETISVSSVEANFEVDVTEGCSPVCVQFTDISTVANAVIENWEWEFADASASVQPNPSNCFNNNSPTEDATFNVRLIVSNSEGCIDTLLMEDFIFVGHNPTSDFDFTPETASSIDPEIYFQNNSIGATSYLWDFGDDFSSIEFNPSFFFDSPGIQQVQMISTTDFGCADSTVKTVRTTLEELIYVPSSFTPDEDGLNDLFFPVVSGGVIDSYEFVIYDRYGQEIFETMDVTEKWNGQFKGFTENYTIDGLYSWSMKVKFKESTETYVREGLVNVFR